MLFGEGKKMNTPSADCHRFSNRQKANKGFLRQPMCQNPLFQRFSQYFIHAFVFKRFAFLPPYHFPIIFLPLYSYTIWRNYRLLPFSRFSSALADKILYLSAKIHNILFLFTFPLYTISETPDFCRKVYFCQIVSIATL